MNTSFNPLPPGYTHVQHTFEPVFDEHSRILILGSFPSVKSREIQFYYGHPQNRFWKLMAQLLDVPVPQSIDEKKTMLLTHGLALWDVIASCDIKGSSDSSIKNAVPADISRILKAADIQTIIAEFVYTGAQCLSGLVNGHVRILFIKRHALIVEIQQGHAVL